jgi:phage shock protein E
MFEFIKNLFRGGDSQKISEAINQGAIIIDVRTVGEFNSGNVKNSINIPLDKIPSNINKIKAYNKPIIVCCASGMRSGRAKSILKENGIGTVLNAGSWMNIKR